MAGPVGSYGGRRRLGPFPFSARFPYPLVTPVDRTPDSTDMRLPLLHTLRFARGWSSPPTDLVEEEIRIPAIGGGEPTSGTLLSPPDPGPLPGWVVLHGITRRGRRHPALRRFIEALAATRARILVPEITEWIRLDLAPGRAQAIIRGAIETLSRRPDVEAGGVVVAGFSFGGPQALYAAQSPGTSDQVRGVLAWGSYADLESTLHFHFTGEHGEGLHEPPDPYGRWVVGHNCLPHLEGRGDLTGVAAALHRLAAFAGDEAVDSRSPAMDPLKAELRQGLAPGNRELFDLFAPPAGVPPEREAAVELVGELTRVALSTYPLLDPIPLLGHLDCPVRLLHGRDDILIPCTQLPVLERRLAPHTHDLRTGLTGLFAHSAGGSELGPLDRARESVHFLRVLRRAFQLV